jgi:hypothetical protein
MSKPVLSRWHIAMNMHSLDDSVRVSLLAGIEQVAPQCPLVQIPTVAASFAALGVKGTAFEAALQAEAQAEAAYHAAVAASAASRGALDLELLTLKSAVENSAEAATDVTGMGFELLTVAKPSRTQPDPPAALQVKIGRAHGKARVVVQGRGYLGSFVAEASPYVIGAGTWAPLPGRGKERKLSG